MTKGLTIIDKDYARWVEQLCKRYRRSQIKAAVKVNQEMLRFYWELGRDICTMKAESRWGSKFMANLSRDLKAMNPDARCFSPTNLLYMKNFYRLYSPCVGTTPQGAEPIGSQIAQQPVEQLPEQKTTQQGVEIRPRRQQSAARHLRIRALKALPRKGGRHHPHHRGDRSTIRAGAARHRPTERRPAMTHTRRTQS